MLLLLALASRSGANAGVINERPLLIQNVSVISMRSEKIDEAQSVLIQGGIIQQIDSKVSIPPMVQVIDAHAKFPIPALSDIHAHIQNEQDLVVIASQGISLIRNMHGPPRTFSHGEGARKSMKSFRRKLSRRVPSLTEIIKAIAAP